MSPHLEVLDDRLDSSTQCDQCRKYQGRLEGLRRQGVKFRTHIADIESAAQLSQHQHVAEMTKLKMQVREMQAKLKQNMELLEKKTRQCHILIEEFNKK